MKITAAFTKQFELETLQSEKLRAAILASYAFFTGIYILGISYLIKNDPATSETKFKLPYTLLFLLAACPDVCLQMLIRGANAVGYTSYPDNGNRPT